MAWASEQEKIEQFHAGTSEHRPADPGDFRFEITDLAAEAAKDGYSAFEDCPAIGVKMIDDKGEVVSPDWCGRESTPSTLSRLSARPRARPWRSGWLRSGQSGSASRSRVGGAGNDEAVIEIELGNDAMETSADAALSISNALLGTVSPASRM